MQKWVFLVGVLIFCVSAPAHAAKVFFDDADGARTAANVRNLGFHCETALWLERIEIDYQGNKVYQLACGMQGPFYRVTITPDGQQYIEPWQ